MPDGEPLTIGEVINLLRDEFPDISVSKVRFLESQGLITPGRSDSGYRQFDRHDVERLRFILQQQRDHFLPLKVIKSKLVLWERGEDPEGPGGAAVAAAGEFPRVEGEPLTRAELLRRSGLTEAQLRELEAHGLITGVEGEVYPPEALVIANEARRLYAYGLEARHIRAVRLAAEREVDILRQLTAPLLRQHHPEARSRARDTLAGCVDAMQVIHRTLLVTEINGLLTE